MQQSLAAAPPSKAHTKSTAAAAAGSSSMPTEQPPVQTKPKAAAAQPKAAQPGAAAASAHVVPPLTQGAGGITSKSAAGRTGSIKRHGSTTSRRLQTLLASEELSSLPVLGSEGSELPGEVWHDLLAANSSVWTASLS